MTSLRRLQQWYSANCDGDWEHTYGVVIDTLDNPGWRIVIDLTGTEAESLELPWTKRESTDVDWVHFWTEEKKFNGAGGPENLEDLLAVFLDFVAGKEIEIRMDEPAPPRADYRE